MKLWIRRRHSRRQGDQTRRCKLHKHTSIERLENYDETRRTMRRSACIQHNSERCNAWTNAAIARFSFYTGSCFGNTHCRMYPLANRAHNNKKTYIILWRTFTPHEDKTVDAGRVEEQPALWLHPHLGDPATVITNQSHHLHEHLGLLPDPILDVKLRKGCPQQPVHECWHNPSSLRIIQ